MKMITFAGVDNVKKMATREKTLSKRNPSSCKITQDCDLYSSVTFEKKTWICKGQRVGNNYILKKCGFKPVKNKWKFLVGLRPLANVMMCMCATIMDKPSRGHKGNFVQLMSPAINYNNAGFTTRTLQKERDIPLACNAPDHLWFDHSQISIW